MSYLKHEMRQLFEKRSSMAFIDKNSGFEDGLLEKIINLAFAGLSIYTGKLWDIIAVSSPVVLQKLYRATGNKMIAECAYTLAVSDRITQSDVIPGSRSIIRHWNKKRETDLLCLSIHYAAKFYCVDSFAIYDFDKQAVAKVIGTRHAAGIAVLICLGFFRDLSGEYRYPARNMFSETVTVI